MAPLTTLTSSGIRRPAGPGWRCEQRHLLRQGCSWSYHLSWASRELTVTQAWTDSIQDTDTVLEHFFTNCYDAKTDCSLYRVGDRVDDIKQRFNLVTASIENEPLISVAQNARLPSVLTISLVKQLLFAATYAPMTTFPLVALLMNELYNGIDLASQLGGPDLVPFCGLKQKIAIYPDDSSTAIGCSDWRKNVSAKASCLGQTNHPGRKIY